MHDLPANQRPSPMWAGIVIHQWSITLLGRYFTVDVRVQSDQTVMDRGPYRWGVTGCRGQAGVAGQMISGSERGHVAAGGGQELRTQQQLRCRACTAGRRRVGGGETVPR
jgi:hypothetical protein